MKLVKKKCNRCKYVGVRTSYVDRNLIVHLLDKSVKAVEDVYIILESKMNIPETFTEFKARTYGRHNDPTYENKNTTSAG